MINKQDTDQYSFTRVSSKHELSLDINRSISIKTLDSKKGICKLHNSVPNYKLLQDPHVNDGPYYRHTRTY